MLTNTGRSFVSNKNLKLSLSTRQTMDVDDRIKRRATRFANLSIFRGREPGSESVPDLCASPWRLRSIHAETRNGPIHSTHKSPPGINLRWNVRLRFYQYATFDREASGNYLPCRLPTLPTTHVCTRGEFENR